MGSVADSIAYWLIDYYLAATALLLIMAAAVRMVRQPARRMAVAWGGFVGLAMLAPLCAIGWWPRFDVVSRLDRLTHSFSAIPARQFRAIEQALGQKFQAGQQTANRDETTFSPSVSGQSPSPNLSAIVAGTRERSVKTTLAEPTVAKSTPTNASASNSRVAPMTGAGRFSHLDWGAARRIGLLAFLLGCGLTAFRIAHGMHTASRLRRRASLAPQLVLAELTRIVGDGNRCPQLLISTLHPVPIATGTIRPTILLPLRFAEQERARDCRSVLAHEWAHIRNGDLWLLALDRWLLPLLWLNPVYRWVRRGIRADQELLADASAAAHSSPFEYAEMLLAWARRLASETTQLHASTALGVWERPSRLAERIAKLLQHGAGTELECPRSWRLGSFTALVSLPLVLSTATVRPVPLPLPTFPGPTLAPRATERVASILAAIVPSVEPALAAAANLDGYDSEFGDPREEWAAEQPALAEIRRLGGHVKTELIGEMRLATEVNMVYGFTQEGVRVENVIFTDDALPQIARLRNLKVLALSGQQATDAGLERLSSLTKLERLCLWDAQSLTDAGISPLAELPALKHLELTNARIGDAAIERIARIRTLEDLSVQGSGLTDRSIALAARLSRLKRLQLDLGEHAVGTAALEAVREMNGLDQLGLQSAAVSDDVLRSLAEMKNLRFLFLGECRVTDQGIESLRESLPKLHLITAQRIYPALAAGTTADECELSIRRSQAAVALARKFARRVGSGSEAAAAQLVMPQADAHRLFAALQGLRSLENLEWNLAYTDPSAALAVSTEFSDAFGGEQVIVCELECADGQWKIGETSVTASREGVEREVRRFALHHPRAGAAKGWLPLPVSVR